MLTLPVIWWPFDLPYERKGKTHQKGKHIKRALVNVDHFGEQRAFRNAQTKISLHSQVVHSLTIN